MKKLIVSSSILSLIFTVALANVKINSLKNNTNSGIKLDLYDGQGQFEKSIDLSPGEFTSNLTIANKGGKMGHLSITPVADGMPYAQPFTYHPMIDNASTDLEIRVQNDRFVLVGTK